MSHRYGLHTLATSPVCRTSAAAAVHQQDRADDRCVRAIVVAIRIGIDDGEDVCVLVSDISVVASAELGTPVYAVSFQQVSERRRLPDRWSCR